MPSRVVFRKSLRVMRRSMPNASSSLFFLSRFIAVTRHDSVGRRHLAAGGHVVALLALDVGDARVGIYHERGKIVGKLRELSIMPGIEPAAGAFLPHQ